MNIEKLQKSIYWSVMPHKFMVFFKIMGTIMEEKVSIFSPEDDRPSDKFARIEERFCITEHGEDNKETKEFKKTERTKNTKKAEKKRKTLGYAFNELMNTDFSNQERKEKLISTWRIEEAELEKIIRYKNAIVHIIDEEMVLTSYVYYASGNLFRGIVDIHRPEFAAYPVVSCDPSLLNILTDEECKKEYRDFEKNLSVFPTSERPLGFNFLVMDFINLCCLELLFIFGFTYKIVRCPNCLSFFGARGEKVVYCEPCRMTKEAKICSMNVWRARQGGTEESIKALRREIDAMNVRLHRKYGKKENLSSEEKEKYKMEREGQKRSIYEKYGIEYKPGKHCIKAYQEEVKDVLIRCYNPETKKMEVMRNYSESEAKETMEKIKTKK